MSTIAGVAGVDIELITSSTSVGESGNGDAPGEAGSDCVGVASSDGDPELDCVAGAGAGADGDPDADADPAVGPFGGRTEFGFPSDSRGVR